MAAYGNFENFARANGKGTTINNCLYSTYQTIHTLKHAIGILQSVLGIFTVTVRPFSAMKAAFLRESSGLWHCTMPLSSFVRQPFLSEEVRPKKINEFLCSNFKQELPNARKPKVKQTQLELSDHL